MIDNPSLFDLTLPKYKITKPIRLIELFAGIGSQAKALKRLNANFEHYRVCEFDKFAMDSYNAIHGTNFETSDVTKIDSEWLGIVDTDKYEYILTYSFPCQDLSLAGKRAGMEKGKSTRSGLLWEVERLLKECHKGGQLPQILLMENVRQVITSKGWHEWCAFLEKLGYSNYCKILNACDYEIPQHRERAFMVSILGEYSYSFPKSQLLTIRLKDMLEKEVDEKYYLSENNIQYILDMNDVALRSGRNINNRIVNPNISKTISCRGATNQRADITNFVIDNLNREITVKELKSLLNKKDCKMSKHLKETLEKNNNIEDGDYLDCYNRSIKKDVITGVIHTRISASNDTFVVGKDKISIMGGKVIIPEATKKGYAIAEDGDGIYINRPHQKRGVVQKGKIQTIKTSVEDIAVVENKPILLGGIGEKDSNNNTQWKQQNRIYSSDSCSIAVTSTFQPYYYYYLRIRKLTPKECFRLMGFDDEDFEKAKKVNSNAQLYKQAGNSIVVNVLCYIFKELL